MGLIKVPVLLQALEFIAEKNGALFKYGHKVEEINNNSCKVGEKTFTAKKNIICCDGGRAYLEKYGLKMNDIYTIHFTGASGLPPAFIDETEKGTFFGLKEGDFLEKYKIGC